MMAGDPSLPHDIDDEEIEEQIRLELLSINAADEDEDEEEELDIVNEQEVSNKQ